jgi:hypothetical protein
MNLTEPSSRMVAGNVAVRAIVVDPSCNGILHGRVDMVMAVEIVMVWM